MGIFKDISLTLDKLNDDLEDYFECYSIAYILIIEKNNKHLEVAYKKDENVEWVNPEWFDGQDFEYEIFPENKIGEIIYNHLQASGILKQVMTTDVSPIDFDKLFSNPENLI
jgi:hypothetical protein